MPRALAKAGCSAMAWFGNQLANVRGECERTATHEQDPLEFRTPAQLSLRFAMQALDHLPLRPLHQIRYILILTEQPNSAALD